MKYILKRIFKGIGFIILAGALAVALFIGFMYVSTGEVNVDSMKSELYSDYRDMDFNRPKKETYFSVAMDNAAPQTEADEQSPMSEEYKQLYDSHLNRMEESLIYLESGDSAILDDEEMLPVLTGELTESISEVEDNKVRYDDEVFMLTLNGRDSIEHERVQASNDAYIDALTDMSIAIEEDNKDMFEESLEDIESAGVILVEGIPEDEQE